MRPMIIEVLLATLGHKHTKFQIQSRLGVTARMATSHLRTLEAAGLVDTIDYRGIPGVKRCALIRRERVLRIIDGELGNAKLRIMGSLDLNPDSLRDELEIERVLKDLRYRIGEL
jgi:DNA-binding HxlR family transcriptional regulator